MDEPEPAPTNRVALRDRREEVIQSLTEHFAADILDMDEFDARLDAAHSATTIVALERLVADLAPLPASQRAAAQAATTTALTIHEDPMRPEKKAITAVFSGFDRTGPWVVPKKMKARVWMAGGRLDFREADFSPGVTELHVSCWMGGIEIIVPPQLAVDVEVSSIMGGVGERHATRSPDPGRAILRITGTVVMGGIDIHTRLPGETQRQARKREKLERKAARGELPRASIAALPKPRDGDQ
jgi:hypothetical protein